MATLDHEALDAIVRPLAELCKQRRFSYSWNVRRTPDGWVAEVAAGFPRVNGRSTGPHPCFRAEAATPEQALGRIVGWQIDHARSYPHGYSGP